MTKIKICGITNLSDAITAADAGAELLGFNFYPKSPRCITPAACRQVTSVLRQKYPRLTLVGVFVNSSVAEIRAILANCHLHLAQLHGDETPDMLQELGNSAFKAIRLSAPQSNPSPAHPLEPFVSAYPFLQSAPASATQPALLVDAAVQGMYGGSGMVTDWSAAAELSKQIPLLLAGGLTPENVAAAVRQVHPWGVDVASGVEISPGKKDPIRIKKFIDAVHLINQP